MDPYDGTAPATWTWKVEDRDITGTTADDTLYGSKGRDRIDGGGGADTVAYGGTRHGYQVEYDAATDTWTVTNLTQPDRDVDTLRGIEHLRFADLEAPIAAFADDAPAALRPLDFAATDDTDQLAGREYGEVIQAAGGDDLLQGNGGDDRLYGGKGEDCAAYRGNLADYELVFDSTEWAFRVTDRVSGRDGSDLLYGVEKLQFGDLTVLLGDDFSARIEGGPELLPPWVPPPYEPLPYEDVDTLPWTGDIGTLDDAAQVGGGGGWDTGGELMLVGTLALPDGLLFDA